MAGISKPEFAPLLPPGRHVLSLAELRVLCVDRFPNSRARPGLFSRLECMLAAIDQLKIVADVWVNGSYLSEKDDPDDIDIAVKLDFDYVNTLDTSADRLIDAIAQGKLDPKLDSYVFINYPVGHARRGTRLDRWDYWAEKWSVARGGWCKGVAVLRLGESDVGLRLFA